MNRAPWALAMLVLAGCRGGGAPIDPDRPQDLPECAAGPHLAIALAARDSESEQALLRFEADGLRQCRGASLPYAEHGDLTAVGGLPDGTDLVGSVLIYESRGIVARFDGALEIDRIEDTELFPISIAPVVFEGEDAVAIVWSDSYGSSSDSGERLSVHAASDLSERGRWDIPYDAIRVARPPSGQGARFGVLILGRGLQEMRADPGATALATTGELQISMPSSGVARALDVVGSEVRASADRGVLFYEGASNAFLGPVSCRWPDVTGTPLPGEGARYVGALFHASDPERTLALVDGELAGGSDETTHVFTLERRGECELLFSIPSTHAAVAMSWSGR